MDCGDNKIIKTRKGATVTQYLSDTQLAARYSVSRSTIWRWTQRGLFPKPVQLSPGTTRWRKDAIERHEASTQSSAA